MKSIFLIDRWFLSNAMVYKREYLARCTLVLRVSVSIDSNAANALSGFVHITFSAVSIIRPASLSAQEEDRTATATAAIILIVFNSLIACRTLYLEFHLKISEYSEISAADL